MTDLVTTENNLYGFGSCAEAGELSDAYGYHDASRRYLEAAANGLWHIVDMITLAARKEFIGAEDHASNEEDDDDDDEDDTEGEGQEQAGTLLNMFGKVKGNLYVQRAVRRIKEKVEQANLDLAGENATNRHVGDVNAYLRAVDKYIDALEKSRFVPCDTAMKAIRAG